MGKAEILLDEINLIKDPMLREFIEYCVDESPDYFFTMPASTTGKHHPSYTLGEGGLIRHTKAAVKIANDLVNLEQNQYLPKDEIISALILHDSIKQGKDESGHTLFEHPILAAEFIEEKFERFEFDVDCGELKELNNQVSIIKRLIKSHMGQWNSDYKTGEEVLPKPIKEDEKFVHMCDYIASRSYLICEVE